MNPDTVYAPEPVDATVDGFPPSPIEDRMAAFTLTPSEEMLQRIGPGRVVPFAPAHRASTLAAIDTLQADLGRPA